MDWTSVIERDLRRLSELSKGDITSILGFLHHDACDGKLYRLVRSSFPFNLSSGPPNWGLCRPSEIPSTISLSLSYVYRNAVEAANAKLPIKWTEEHVELYLEATIVSCWSSLSENESENADPDLGELEIGTDLLNEISLQPVGQKDSRIWGLWAVLDFLNHSRKQNETFSNGSLIYNAAMEAMKRIEQGRSYNSEPEALLTAVTTQFTSIMQKSKSGGSIKSPRDANVEQIVTLTQNQNISHHHNNSGNSSSVMEITSNIEDSSSSSTSVKPVESHRAAIRYVPSKRLGGRAHVFSLSSTTSSTMAATPAVNKINDATQYGYSSSYIGNSHLNITGSNDNIYGSMNCDPKTPIPIRRQKIDEPNIKLTDNTKAIRENMNIDVSNVQQQVNRHREYGRRIGFNIEENGKNVVNSNTGTNIHINHTNISGGNGSNASNSVMRMDTESEVDMMNGSGKNELSQNPFVCKYSLEPAVKYPGYKLEVNGKYYEIISSIQKGGSSQVYKVKESKTGEMYALKCVRVFTKNHDHSNSHKDPEEKSIQKEVCPTSGSRSRKSIRKSIANNSSNGVNEDEEDEDEDEDDDNEEQQLLLMFTEEVNLLKKLRGCPHVIQLIDSEIALSCGAIDIIMELGVKDLNGILQGSTPLPSINVLRSIWTEMVLALKNVHDLRIVHGDIKPANFVFVEKKGTVMGNGMDTLVNLNIENINNTNNCTSVPSELLDESSSSVSNSSIEKSKLQNKTVKIIDFGISRPIADDTTHIFRDKAVGSLPFMAPETVRPVAIPESKFAAAAVASKLRMPHQVMSRTADIWSLGAILYRITYKRHLFQQPIVNANKSSNTGTAGGKKSGSSGKSNIAPHEILMFLQNDQSKISFPREMGIMFSEQAENESLWFDALRHLLKWTLQWDPSNRPNVNQLLTHPFIDTAIVSRYVMQQIPKSIPNKHPSISDDYLIYNVKHNSQTDEDRAALLELLFKSTIPLSDLYKSKPKNIYLSSMRWNIVTNGNFLFYSLFEALKANLNADQGQPQQGSCEQSMINNLAISQYISLVKEVSIPSPPSVNTLNTTTRNGNI
ncbi:protein kinase [Cryptosporidium ubiquitum]|uniref:Protein kinase n=1 Tax=Cryptosporidium ubiquitum TaxID=857276 RepID=A0A1J4MH80_9CRYT|nr:protein kinase [Cryptosporidium ubiquitum]OII72197.1 protein kinase [Cryptosporidium ubiquitum]